MKRNLTILFILIGHLAVSQTRIEQSKSELSSNNSKEYRSYSASGGGTTIKQSTGYRLDDDMTLQEWIAGGIMVVASIVSYQAAIGSYKNEDHLYNHLSCYPYKDNRFGNYSSIDSASAKNNFRVDIENSILLIDNNLYGNHVKTRIRPFHYAFVQIDYHQLAEFNPDKSKNDYLALIGINLCYDRIRFNRFNLGFSLGANYAGNEVKKAGFCYGIQSEAFLPLKISLAGAARFSRINKQPVNQFELKARYHIGRWHISTGYEMLKIASPDYHFFAAGVGIYL